MRPNRAVNGGVLSMIRASESYCDSNGAPFESQYDSSAPICMRLRRSLTYDTVNFEDFRFKTDVATALNANSH